MIVTRSKLMNICRWASALIIPPLCLMLSYACWQVANTEAPKQLANKAPLWWNPFYSASLEQANNFAAQAYTARRHLSFMTFESARAKDAKTLLIALQDHVGHQPFRIELWLELMHVQAELNAPAPERIWAMRHALKLGAWQPHVRYAVIAQCLHPSGKVFNADPQFCKRLLTNMPSQSRYANAVALGMREKDLAQRMRELGLRSGK